LGAGRALSIVGGAGAEAIGGTGAIFGATGGGDGVGRVVGFWIWPSGISLRVEAVVRRRGRGMERVRRMREGKGRSIVDG